MIVTHATYHQISFYLIQMMVVLILMRANADPTRCDPKDNTLLLYFQIGYLRIYYFFLLLLTIIVTVSIDMPNNNSNDVYWHAFIGRLWYVFWYSSLVYYSTVLYCNNNNNNDIDIVFHIIDTIWVHPIILLLLVQH